MGPRRFRPIEKQGAKPAPARVCPLDQIVHQAEPPDQRLHEAYRARRVLLDRGNELFVRSGEAFRVGRRPDCRRSRPGLDQAHFAEHLARLQRVDRPGVGALTDDDFDRPADDEERRVAVVAFDDDRVSGLERDVLHA